MEDQTTHVDVQVEAHVEVTEDVGSPKRSFFERAAGLLLLISIIATPLFFLPGLTQPFGKIAALASLVIAASILCTFSVIKKENIRIIKSPVALAFGAVILATLVSAILNGAFAVSFIGYGFEIHTVSFLLLMGAFLWLVISLFRSSDTIFYSYLLVSGTAMILALYHLLRFIFGPDFLSFGIFGGTLATPLGRWNDLAVLFAVSVVLVVLTRRFLPLHKTFKIFLWILLGLSIFFLAVVNFRVIWILLALFSAVFVLGDFLRARKAPEMPAVEGEGEFESAPKRSMMDSLKPALLSVSFALLVISAVFVFAGGQIGGWLAPRLNAVNVEVKPSWASTVNVAKETLSENPLLGIGPNRFTYAWHQVKPLGVNQTPFWNTDFASGYGWIPTFVITTGILGSIAWAAFFIFYLLLGRATYRRARESDDVFLRYVSFTSLALSFFLWVALFVYTPGIYIIMLAFLTTGLLIASHALLSGGAPFKVISRGKTKLAVVITAVLVLLLAGEVAWGYLYTGKIASSFYFQKSLAAFSIEGDMDKTERNLRKAIELSENDIYYRALADYHLVRLGILDREGGELPAQEIQARFQEIVQAASSAAQRAVELNPQDYQNWLELAAVYETLVPLGIPDSYETALASYDNALQSNPRNPGIFVRAARLELARENIDGARNFLFQAINMKPNYTDAIFLYSQIEASAGNLAEAISAADLGVQSDPTNPAAFFQLGLLLYHAGDYPTAILAFEEAIKLAPDYANAKYFLGLSLNRVGENARAIALFEQIQETNPDNTEIAGIIENLRAGRPPLGSAAASAPEEREAPPIEAEEIPVEESDAVVEE